MRCRGLYDICTYYNHYRGHVVICGSLTFLGWTATICIAWSSHLFWPTLIGCLCLCILVCIYMRQLFDILSEVNILRCYMHNLCYNKITVSVGTINAKLLTFGYYAFGVRNTAKGFQGRIGHFCTCLFFLRFEGDYNSYAGIISFLKLKELANYNYFFHHRGHFWHCLYTFNVVLHVEYCFNLVAETGINRSLNLQMLWIYLLQCWWKVCWLWDLLMNH